MREEAAQEPDEGEWINQVCARIHRRTHAHARTHTVECYLTNLKKGALTQAVMRTSLADVREEA